MEDPRSFLGRFPDGGVIDEVQRCPDIISYLQTVVDDDGLMGVSWIFRVKFVHFVLLNPF